MPPPIKDRIEIRYGRLVVIELHSQDLKGHTYWLCKCDCGNKVIISGDHLQSGTQSCGCLLREINSKLGKKRTDKNNFNYKDGKHIKAIYELKEKCRKDANYKCQECGKTQKQNKEETNEILSVHHIDGDDTNNNLDNLKVLCKYCHSKIRKEI